MDKIRVIRIVEYVGPRDAVEENIRNSLQGTKAGARGKTSGGYCMITAVTLGVLPENLGDYVEEKKEEEEENV